MPVLCNPPSASCQWWHYPTWGRRRDQCHHRPGSSVEPVSTAQWLLDHSHFHSKQSSVIASSVTSGCREEVCTKPKTGVPLVSVIRGQHQAHHPDGIHLLVLLQVCAVDHTAQVNGVLHKWHMYSGQPLQLLRLTLFGVIQCRDCK